MSEDPRGSGHANRPVLRVISGSPTSEEIAVILAIVSRGAGTAGQVLPAPPASMGTLGRWGDREGLIPEHWVPGPGAWRASTLPR